MNLIVEKLWQCLDIAEAENFTFVRHLTAVAMLQATEERDDLEANEEDDRQIAARGKTSH